MKLFEAVTRLASAVPVSLDVEKLVKRRVLPDTGKDAYRNKWEDLATLCSTTSPTVVDGGGHTGESIRAIQSHFGDPQIHSFEANPESYQQLKSFEGESVSVYGVAIGSERDEREFKVSQFEQASSLLSPTTEVRETFGDRVSTEKTVTVTQRRLDEVMSSPPDVIKLDLQGYEREALEGASGFLQSVELVLLETSLCELYDGQPSFSEINRFMKKKDFELFNIYDRYVDGDGKLVEFDVIYRKSEHTSGSRVEERES